MKNKVFVFRTIELSRNESIVVVQREENKIKRPTL